MFVRFFQTEFRTRVKGVTVPHTRPDCMILVVHSEATRHLYTTRAHVTQLFIKPIKTFWFFVSFSLTHPLFAGVWYVILFSSFYDNRSTGIDALPAHIKAQLDDKLCMTGFWNALL